MPELFAGVIGIVYLTIIIFTIRLALRLVRAVERIADKIDVSAK